MTNSELIKLNQQAIDAWNMHDAVKYIELCDDGINWNISGTSQTLKGKNEVRDFFNNWKTGFPDVNLKIKNQFVSEDQILVEYEFNGTHNGSFRLSPDMPVLSATHKKVTTYGCYVAKFKNKKVIELNNYPDRLSLVSQLGVLSELEHQTI